MRVMGLALAALGCSTLPVSAVVRAPVASHCQATGTNACPESAEGAAAHADGRGQLAMEKPPAQSAPPPPQSRPPDLAQNLPATLPSPDLLPSFAHARRAIAQRLALYAITAREDPARRVTETIELADAPGTACQVAGSDAICLRRQKGPFVVTDVVTSEECGWRVLLAVSDSDVPAPLFAFSWLLPARAQGVHGASFALRGGQWLYVAVKAAKPSPNDRGCFVTWSGFRPRLVPSLADDSSTDGFNLYRSLD